MKLNKHYSHRILPTQCSLRGSVFPKQIPFNQFITQLWSPFDFRLSNRQKISCTLIQHDMTRHMIRYMRNQMPSLSYNRAWTGETLSKQRQKSSCLHLKFLDYHDFYKDRGCFTCQHKVVFGGSKWNKTEIGFKFTLDDT